MPCLYSKGGFTPETIAWWELQYGKNFLMRNTSLSHVFAMWQDIPFTLAVNATCRDLILMSKVNMCLVVVADDHSVSGFLMETRIMKIESTHSTHMRSGPGKVHLWTSLSPPAHRGQWNVSCVILAHLPESKVVHVKQPFVKVLIFHMHVTETRRNCFPHLNCAVTTTHETDIIFSLS